MNLNKQFLNKTILLGSLGLATMLFRASSSRAQEISPDHFTNTGVQNVYDGNSAAAPFNATASSPKQPRLNSQVHNRKKLLLASQKRETRVIRRLVADSRP